MPREGIAKPLSRFVFRPRRRKCSIDMVAASGLTKQDYITSCLLKHEITVIPNSRTYRGLYDEKWRVYRELRRIRRAGDLSQDLEDVLIVLSKEFIGLRDELSDVEKEEAAITALKRG